MSCSVLQEFESHDVYSAFLETNFDPKVHASQVVDGVVIADHLNKLSAGISKLEKEIENQVTFYNEDLLTNASGIDALEDVLTTMHSRIQTVLAGVERLRARVVEPFTTIEKQTVVLGRLQISVELLRRVLRYLLLSQRLEEQMQNYPKDIAKAAISLYELEMLHNNSDLTGINVLEKVRHLTLKSRNEVEKQASSMLDDGLTSLNQIQTGTALQVYFNLGTLKAQMKNIHAKFGKKLRKKASSTLDVQTIMMSIEDSKRSIGPGHALMPVSGQSAQFRANLWTGLEHLMDDVYYACLNSSHLYKVLSKKRDSATHVFFLTEVEDKDVSLFLTLWKDIIIILTEEFSKAVTDSNFIRQALEVDYPRLLRLLGSLCKKLENISSDISTARVNAYLNTHSSVSDVEEGCFKFEPEKDLRSSVSVLERAYMSRSLSRLFDAVNVMFSTPIVPSKDEIDVLIKTITNELNVSAVDNHLQRTVAKNVVKTIHLFCQKCEQLVVTGGDASQVIEPPTAAQKLNSSIVDQLWYVYLQIERIIKNTAFNCFADSEPLQVSLAAISSLIDTVVDPLYSSLSATIEAIIITVHQENFAGEESTDSCSLYMKELHSFIKRANSDYMTSSHIPVIKEKKHYLARTTLDLFVRHTSLIRPLGQGGKSRLAADFDKMESIISFFVNRLADLGDSYRIFRSVKPLIFETVENIVKSSLIPHSLILHFLFAKAPKEIKSPHESAGWSESRYSKWLDDHVNEKERLELIEGCLEAYVASVKSRNQSEFAPIYPIMVELLRKGLEKQS